MKKIISLLAAMAMMASVSVTSFAAIPEDATAPQAKVTVTDTGAELSDGYATYEMTIDLTDIGTVTYTPIKVGPATKYEGTKIAQFNFQVNSENIFYNADVSGNLGATGWSGTGDSSEFKGIYVSYLETALANNYPLVESATDCMGAVKFTFFGVPGETITLSDGLIGYGTYVKGAASGRIEYLNVTFDKTEIVLGGEDEPAALDMTVDFNGKYNNGYVWQANITKGENDIDSFTAKFTAGAETADRAITNVEDMVGKFSGGQLSFNIGLDTTKTLTGAEFTVGAGAESKTVAAPLE